MINIQFCQKQKEELLSNYFQKLTESLPIYNIFNPSFYIDDHLRICAFRAIPNGSKEIMSYLSIEDKSGRTIKNISELYCDNLQKAQLIDPKITKINNEFYLTFNSGWSREDNDIFIMKIYPTIEAPKKVIYNGRQSQERNWAFFSNHADIYALYWINPLKILKLKNKTQSAWEMEDFYQGTQQDFSNSLTIGTQLYDSHGKYYFIAHKKLSILRKKLYLGRLCEFNFQNKQITLGNNWLVHSVSSLFGSITKHNTNLLSCTYFSGLQIFKGQVRLGYGVNDIDYGFSSHKLESLQTSSKDSLNPISEKN